MNVGAGHRGGRAEAGRKIIADDGFPPGARRCFPSAFICGSIFLFPELLIPAIHPGVTIAKLDSPQAAPEFLSLLDIPLITATFPA